MKQSINHICKYAGSFLIWMFFMAGITVIIGGITYGTGHVDANTEKGTFTDSTKASDDEYADGIFTGTDWDILDNELYGTGATEDSGGEMEESFKEEWEEPGMVEKALFTPFGNASRFLWLWAKSWRIDITIDGLIYGRLSETYQGIADFTHFGLEANNPYGVASSVMYYALRYFFLLIMPIILVAKLFFQLFKNEAKGRAQLKEMSQNMLVSIVLMFAMPFLLNYFIYVRDGLMWTVNRLMSGMYKALGITTYDFGTSIVESAYVIFTDNPGLLGNLIFSATVGASFFFFGFYIVVAGLLAGLFGIFPLVAFISIWNRKILMEWWNMFFPNAIVGLIDLFLMQIPSIVYVMYKNIFDAVASPIFLILILILMFSETKFRGYLMKLLGFSVMGGSRSGLIPLVFAAMRMLGGGMFGGGRGGSASSVVSSEGVKASVERAEDFSERASIMERADRGMQRPPSLSLPDMEDASYDAANKTDELIGKFAHEDAEATVENVAGYDYGMSDTKDLHGGELQDDMDVGSAMGGELSEVDAMLSEDLASVENMAVRPAELDAVAVENESGVMGDIPGQSVSELSLAETGISSQEAFRQLPGMEGVTFDDIKPMREFDSVLMQKSDNDFSAKLSSRDRNRYDNLAKMDACNELIRSNEGYMSKVGYHADTYAQEKETCLNNIKKLDTSIANTHSRLSSVQDTSSQEYQQLSERARQLVAERNNNVARVNELNCAARMDRNNAIYKQKADGYAQRESQYAYNSGLGGMSDRKYSSASDYKHQTQINEIYKKRANYQNFDSRQYEGILTPREKEQFYRERALKEHERKIVEVAAKAGGVALGTMAAGAGVAFSAYGGSTAAGMAGMLGYSLASRSVGGLVTSSYNAGENMSSANKPNVSRSTAGRPKESKSVTVQGTSPVSIEKVQRGMEGHANAGVRKYEASKQTGTSQLDALNKELAGNSDRAEKARNK